MPSSDVDHAPDPGTAGGLIRILKPAAIVLTFARE